MPDDVEQNEGDGSLSLKEALEQAFNEAADAENDVGAEEAGAEEVPVDQKDEGEAVDGSEEMPIYQAPTNWKAEEKALFNKLPDELELEDGTVVPVKELLSKYDKSRTADYTRKTSELAEQRKEVSSLIDLIEPYKDNFSRLGVKPEDYINNLLNIDAAISRDPAGTIKMIVDKYNLSAGDLGLTDSESDEDYLSDEERRFKILEKQNAELQKRLETLDQRYTTNEHNTAQKEAQVKLDAVLSDFANAADDSGNLAHPHFENEDVKAEMSRYLQKDSNMTLEQAYELSPTVRLLELEKSNQVTPEMANIRTRKEVAKAKKMSLRVKPSGPSDFSEKTSLIEELSARIRASHA